MRAKDLLGRRGEDIAADHLIDAGLHIIERNWRCDRGEIDIIARDGDVLVFCEVKTRSSARFGHPLEAVSAVKMRRLHGLALRYVHERGIRGVPMRIDVIGILSDREGQRIWHVRGAT
jgi:putative endonuclease